MRTTGCHLACPTIASRLTHLVCVFRLPLFSCALVVRWIVLDTPPNIGLPLIGIIRVTTSSDLAHFLRIALIPFGSASRIAKCPCLAICLVAFDALIVADEPLSYVTAGTCYTRKISLRLIDPLHGEILLAARL